MANFPTIAIGLPFVKAGGLDADAVAFLTAAGITDATITNAINRLVKNYKGVGDLNSSVDFWTGTKAIYPFVTDKTTQGDMASQMKFNLKDPRDLDAAYRLSFLGGWTYGANGITGNGITSLANTYLNPSIDLSVTSNSYGIYVRNNTSKGYDLGAFSTTPTKDTMLCSRYTDGKAYFSVTGTTYRSATNANSQGMTIFSKNGATTNNLYLNSTSIVSSSDSSNYANDNFRIGSGGGGYLDYSNHNYAFAFISTQGLSSTNVTTLTNLIQAFQTDISRNV
jgi:hypothetical protein